MYALSACRTGSCRWDEKQKLAVYILHPAAAHDRDNTCYAALRTTAKEVFFMKKIREQFQESSRELKKLNTLVLTALMIALGIVLGQFSIQFTQDIKVGISFIATQLTATMFGPVVGGVMGGVADIVKFIIKPTGAFSILWTLNAIVGPMIYGVMLYKKKFTFWRVLLSKAVVAIVVNVCMSCTWSAILYGSAFWAVLPTKIVQQIIQVPIQSVIFYFFVKSLQKAGILSLGTREDNRSTGTKYTFQYICSLLVPLVGFILGSILLSKDDDEQKQVGKDCVVLGIFSCVFAALILGMVI